MSGGTLTQIKAGGRQLYSIFVSGGIVLTRAGPFALDRFDSETGERIKMLSLRYGGTEECS